MEINGEKSIFVSKIHSIIIIQISHEKKPGSQYHSCTCAAYFVDVSREYFHFGTVFLLLFKYAKNGYSLISNIIF